jgi:hypothetical protein
MNSSKHHPARTTFAVAVFACLSLAACGPEPTTLAPVAESAAEPPAQREAGPGADRVFVNGHIWTGTEPAWAESLAIADGRIAAVGLRQDVEALAGGTTEVIDLDGHTVVPGFIDNHVHFIRGGLAMQRVDLRDADSPEEFARRIGERARQRPGEWITEGSWDHEMWGGELPHRDWIDAITGDTPVFVMRLDWHMALANSAALRLAGIDDATGTPAGGEIIRDADGRITGLLKDEAMALVNRVIPLPTDAQIDEALQAATDHALARGVTQVHDMGEWGHLEAFQRTREAGVLRLRVYEFAPIAHAEELAAYVEERGRGDDWLSWGGVKGFVDGSLGSTTAWFYQPYSDAPETSGLTMGDTDVLAERIATADRLGLQVAIHAIGDRANDWLLDTFESVIAANGPGDRRFRIEHAQHLTAEAIPRFGALGVIPSMQPYHCIDDGRWAEKRIGPDRIQRTYAFRSLLDAGAPLTFGSDWAVAPIDPLTGMYAAVTRRTIDDQNPGGWVPVQMITAEEAVRAYTETNAWAGSQEDRLGRISPGFLADFVVLAEDPFAVDPVRLREIAVLRTVIGGRDAFVAEPAAQP